MQHYDKEGILLLARRDNTQEARSRAGGPQEGTRAPVKKWKSGFHRMAMELGIPVYMGYFDWKTKHVGRGEKIELTGDFHTDLVRIQKHYKKMGVVGRHPEKLAYLDEVTLPEQQV